jgi:hypothetical protein
MKYDLSKTQFLQDEHGSFKAYRHKSDMMLFDREGIPLRPMTWTEWCDFKTTYADEIERDGLTLRTVWTLVGITR